MCGGLILLVRCTVIVGASVEVGVRRGMSEQTKHVVGMLLEMLYSLIEIVPNVKATL